MPQLLILCPNTRRLLPTNRSIRAAALAGTDLGVNTFGPCPHCGERHTRTIADAYLPGLLAADATGLPPRVVPAATMMAQEGPPADGVQGLPPSIVLLAALVLDQGRFVSFSDPDGNT